MYDWIPNNVHAYMFYEARQLCLIGTSPLTLLVVITSTIYVEWNINQYGKTILIVKV